MFSERLNRVSNILGHILEANEKRCIVTVGQETIYFLKEKLKGE